MNNKAKGEIEFAQELLRVILDAESKISYKVLTTWLYTASRKLEYAADLLRRIEEEKASRRK